LEWPQRDPELWNRLVTDFGPQRRQTGLHPDVHFAAPFVGNAVRLEVLARYGKHQEVLDESAGYYQYMADATGTLWEVADRKASCNHGFASYLAVLYFRCALGVDHIDPVNRVVRLVQPDVTLDWCEGRIPLGGGALLEVRWWREGKSIKRALRVPAGYRVHSGE
jgi:alpha-L-rhamnosidase